MVSNIFYVHPYLGKIPILTHIFQMGWSHQLDYSRILVHSQDFFELLASLGFSFLYERNITFKQKSVRMADPGAS